MSNDDTDDDGEQWKQVNVRIKQHRYNDWKEHVGREPGDEYGTVSQLIRHAVARELHGEHGPRVTDDMDGATIEADMSPITDDVMPALQGIKQQLSEMDNRLTAVERNEQADTSGIDLERIVLELLPAESELDGLSEAMSVAELSKATGASPDDIRDTLDSLNDRRRQTVVADEGHQRMADGEAPLVYYRSE
jgi:hypothetical protein